MHKTKLINWPPSCLQSTWVAAGAGTNTVCVHVCARACERTRAIFLFTLGPQINSLPSINLCTNKNLAGRQMQLTHIMGGNRRERAYSYALIGNICRSHVNTCTRGPYGPTVGRVAAWLKGGWIRNCIDFCDLVGGMQDTRLIQAQTSFLPQCHKGLTSEGICRPVMCRSLCWHLDQGWQHIYQLCRSDRGERDWKVGKCNTSVITAELWVFFFGFGSGRNN